MYLLLKTNLLILIDVHSKLNTFCIILVEGKKKVLTILQMTWMSNRIENKKKKKINPMKWIFKWNANWIFKKKMTGEQNKKIGILIKNKIAKK